ncbi:MAG: DinB family protein [Bryobacteraceae bacterium]|nr:DinB family protein [Bryobacteraceae bacterium]
MTAAEVEVVLAQMSHSDATLRQTLAGVSEAQWRWKPDVDVWSLNEIAEHLVVVEQGILFRLRKAPSDGIEKTEGKTRLPDMLVNRKVRFPAPGRTQPTGQKYATPDDCLRELATARAATLAWVADPNTNLNSHVMPHPAFGELHGGQWLQMLHGHTLRHLEQMREVMAAPGYPAA